MKVIKLQKVKRIVRRHMPKSRKVRRHVTLGPNFCICGPDLTDLKVGLGAKAEALVWEKP